MLANAAVLYEVNKPLVVEDVEVLEPGAHEVRVKWAANGVCHSDLHVMTGDYPHPLPVVLGHEAAGRGRARRARRRVGAGGRSRLLELYPVMRPVLVLPQRPAHDVRAAGQAALVHAGWHAAIPRRAGRGSTTSSRSPAMPRIPCCRKTASSRSGRTRRSTSPAW